MKRRRNSVSAILSIFLIIGLLGTLVAYLIAVGSLETQVYTPDQQSFLSYNDGRAVSQAPVTLNLYRSVDGAVLADFVPGSDLTAALVPANFTVWENEVRAGLSARYEEQEGVSVTLYDLDFESTYHFQHDPNGVTTTLELLFPFPNNLETLNGVQLLVGESEPENVQYTTQQIRWLTTLVPGEIVDVAVKYRADGANRFSYRLSQDRRTDNLDVQLTVEGLRSSEVPRHSLPNTAVANPDADTETFTWQYENLVANRDIHLELPQQLSFAQRLAALQDDFATLSLMAPFLVGLFLAALAAVLYVQQVRLGIPGYLLMGFGFVLFYPMLTFLSGVGGVAIAALIALITVAGLLLLFLRIAVKKRRLDRWLIWLLLLFLGVFSLGMLTPWRGLTLTTGGLMLVATFMVVYARRPLTTQDDEDAGEVERVAPDLTRIEKLSDAEHTVEEAAVTTDTAPALATGTSTMGAVAAAAATVRAYCPRCGRALHEDYSYCPGCGYDGSQIARCASCGHEQVTSDVDQTPFCLHCGAELVDPA